MFRHARPVKEKSLSGRKGSGATTTCAAGSLSDSLQRLSQKRENQTPYSLIGVHAAGKKKVWRRLCEKRKRDNVEPKKVLNLASSWRQGGKNYLCAPDFGGKKKAFPRPRGGVEEKKDSL